MKHPFTIYDLRFGKNRVGLAVPCLPPMLNSGAHGVTRPTFPIAAFSLQPLAFSLRNNAALR